MDKVISSEESFRGYLEESLCTEELDYHFNQLKQICRSSKNDGLLEEVKGVMWLFRKHWKNLTEEEQEKLTSAFKVSPWLKRVYDFREGLWLFRFCCGLNLHLRHFNPNYFSSFEI